MSRLELRGVAVVPGGGRPALPSATVVVDRDGIVAEIEPQGASSGLVLMPPVVDLHLDVVAERRRPRASVELDIERVVVALDTEVAAAGIGTLCIAARCEDEPRKGVRIADAAALAEVIERLGPGLACDWRVHARVEVTDEASLGALEDTLAATSRVALISVMDHSAAGSRFGSEEEHVAYYAEDWGIPVGEVRRIMERKRRGLEGAAERRAAAAAIARREALALASHDDRTPAHVRAAYGLGARVAEFPLTREAALEARALAMHAVLGAPNAVRGRSTSPGNLLVADAVTAGACDALCSDYLPGALLAAPFVLADRGVTSLERAVALVTDAPAAAIGLEPVTIDVGRPLEAALVDHAGATARCVGLWRAGRLRYGAAPLWDRSPTAA